MCRCREDGNILETKARVRVLICTGLEAPQTPSPRDYPNLVITSIIKWAKPFGSNSYERTESVLKTWPQQRNTQSTFTDLSPAG